MTAEVTLTSKQIHEFLRALHHHHGSAAQWCYYEELATSTGSDKKNILDAWAMHVWPSTNFERITYEVKVSRSDFAREIASPQKRKSGLLYSNRFYFVTPEGLVKPAEIPAECGLLEFDADGRERYTVHAPWRDMDRPTWAFMAAAMREAQRLADKRVTAQVLTEYEERERTLTKWREDLRAQQDAQEAARRQLHEEWQKCRDAQRAAGLNTPYHLPIAKE